MVYQGKTGEYLQLENRSSNNCLTITDNLQNPLTFLWFNTDNNTIAIDGKEYIFNCNQIVCLTEFHNLEISKICNTKLLLFNRAFLCIIESDSDIGCKGLLFFGASKLPILTIPINELEKFETIWRMFEMEIESVDDMQLEMLQIMLKRFIILCTRLYKNQYKMDEIAPFNMNIIREFNFLVETHFKTKHTVGEYALLLNKSPKTISNLFLKFSNKTPLKYIQERKLLEAKRQLIYSNKSVKEVAYDIGFQDIQTFSRFFKNLEGKSPSEYKTTS